MEDLNLELRKSGKEKNNIQLLNSSPASMAIYSSLDISPGNFLFSEMIDQAGYDNCHFQV